MPVSWFRPWQSVWLPRVITVVALLAGLPLFLRMPLWCDLTLYDVAARNIMRGGIHYRDVFDTNLPGFVWLLAGIRSVLGFSAFALRCVDLAIVTSIVLLIDRVAKRGGATPVTRWWAFAGVAMLYPFAVEMAHCQRDTWMALPIMAAVWFRVRRASLPSERPFLASAVEGVLWGVAVWIKPHVVLMAAGVWLVTARRLAGVSQRPWRTFALDLLGNLAGGLIVGAAGIAYLISSGTWPYFYDLITVWAPEYGILANREIEQRLEQELHWFPPWSLWLALTVPLAVFSIIDAVPWASRPTDTTRPGPIGRLLPAWLWDRVAGPDARFARGTLAALYLVWAFQSFYIQRGFMYVHMAETFIMFGLWAAHRWAMPLIVFVWLVLTTSAWVIADANPAFYATMMRVADHDGLPGEDPDKEHYLVRHPIADYTRMRHWADCWRTNLTDRERYQLWDRIKRIQSHEASPGWEELADIADYLRDPARGGGVGDRELIAWHDSPHALYLTMDLQPGLRFMHLNTAMIISPEAKMRVLDELYQCKGTAKFAVSDLGWAALGQKPEVRSAMLAPPQGPDDLYPPKLKNWMRATFPFNQPAVFRSGGGLGRYIVHKLTPPLGDWPYPDDPQGP